MSHEQQAGRSTAVVKSWLSEPMSHEVRMAVERIARADDVVRVAVMPDVHLAYGVCVGSVIATRRLVYPPAVGSDIGCGMLAIGIDAGADLLRRSRTAERLLEALPRAAPPMRHRNLESAPGLPMGLCADALSDASLARDAFREGRIELGTLGRGNHFVEFQADDEERLWLMIHSGSRHMGQAIHDRHVAGATRAAGGLCVLDSETAAGQAYLADVAWARAYADANRREMLRAIADVLETRFGVRVVADTLISVDHNHVQREVHDGEALWIHRKGAMSAREDEPGVIPGSMGTHSFHVTGRGCAESLHSCSHGAGRRLSRNDARQRIGPQRLIKQLDGVWFDRRLAARLCEEAPSAYKDVDAVFRAQRELTRITRRLRPVLVYKGV
ncbi:MAG: RtcB family protein [Phycisphaerales bacterium]|nr:RtcB family protein [Phycisphaerales bacterium]